MALSSPFGVQDVQNEIATNTLSGLANQNSFADMYAQVFGSAGTGDSLQDFDGTGQPSGGTADGATAVDEDSADLNGTIGDYGGVDGSARFEYDTDSNFGSSTTTSYQTINTDSFSLSELVSGLSSSTTYYYRVEYYNPFNDASGDHKFSSSSSFTTDSGCGAPQNVSVTESFNGNEITWDDPAGGNPANGYEIQYSVNFGAWQYLTDTSSTANSYVHDGCNTDYANGDDVQYRVKSQCSGGDSAWETSNTINISSCF